MDIKKAIEIIKSHYPTNKQMLNEALEYLIPELKESEDERIRKTLINYFEHHTVAIKIFYGIRVDDILAWLEKQGKTK